MALSAKYDRFYQQPGSWDPAVRRVQGWPRNRVEAILADAPPGGRVLDVGCGSGQLLAYLRDRYEELVGLEYSAHRLDEARRNLAGLPFHGVLGTAEDMRDVATATIDCIVSADVIEHIPDVYAAAAEMHRVLKPGGTLVINTPNIAYVEKRVLLLAGRFPSTSQANEGLGSDVLFDGGHLHYFTFRSLRLLLERAGFVMTKRRAYGKRGRWHALYPPLLSVGVQWVATRP